MRITNDILKLYLKLKCEQKIIEGQLSDLRSLIIEHNGAQTLDYIAVVKNRERKLVAGQDAFIAKMGAGWLENEGLITSIIYKEVEVLVKPNRTVQPIDMSIKLQEKSNV